MPTDDDDTISTLKLALAMRGGVSLAVWIGGVVAELDLFRRACNGQLAAEEPAIRTRRAETYRDLFATTKYDKVEIDILAGASAGGLNAVLYGLAQTCQTVMDETVREVWIEEGGLWELLRTCKPMPTNARGFTRLLHSFHRRVPSLLQGDERLFTMANSALGTLAGAPPDGVAAPLSYPSSESSSVIAVELAATLLNDIYSPGRSNRAGFSFRRTPAGLDSKFSTIPDSDEVVGPDGTAALNRLALAARSTSSFPGAFEPAKIYSSSIGNGATSLKVDMSRVFPYARANSDPEPFNVVDGGIFDNIPIDRAFRAIQRSPASQPTERRLVYIDPEPPAKSYDITPPDQTAATSWLRVINGSRALQQREEKSGDELELLHEHNDAVLRTRGRLETLAAALRSAQERGTRFVTAASVSDDTYTQYRIAQDSQRIAALLTDPAAELCRPPSASEDYEPLPSSQALWIKNHVEFAYNKVYPRLQPRPSLVDDVVALQDRVRLMMAWIRMLERLHATPPAGADLHELEEGLPIWKRRLYRYLTVLDYARRVSVDAVLAAPLKAHKPLESRRTYVAQRPMQPDFDKPPTTLIETMIDSTCQQAQLSIEAMLPWLRPIGRPGDLTGRDLLNAMKNWNPLSGPPDLRTQLDDHLEQLRVAIRDGSRDVALAASRSSTPELKGWRESIYPHFYDQLDISVANLVKLFAVSDIPDTASMIYFDTITSAEPPHIDVDLLRDAARAKFIQTWVTRPPEPKQIAQVLEDPSAIMGANAKLAGNVLARFGGFLLARWRENDWQWGRLDAAAGIVKLCDNSRDTQLPPEESADLAKRLQDSILSESRDSAATNDGEPPIVQSAGADTLDVVAPQYRFALASRIVPLAWRAVLPASEQGGLRATLTWLGLLLLRPVTVIVPLFADALRLVLALCVVIGAAGLLGAHNISEWWNIVFVVLGGVVIWYVWKHWRGWHTVKTYLEGIDLPAESSSDLEPDRWFEIHQKATATAKPWLCAALAIGLASLAIGFGPLAVVVIKHHKLGETGWSIPAETLVLVFSVLAGLAVWFHQHGRKVASSSYASVGPRAERLNRWFRALFSNGWRSPQASRLVRVAVSGFAIVAVIFVGCMSYASAQKDRTWFERAFPQLPNADTLANWPSAAWITGIAVGLLTTISVWGWAKNLWAVVAIAVGVALGVGAQCALGIDGPPRPQTAEQTTVQTFGDEPGMGGHGEAAKRDIDAARAILHDVGFWHQTNPLFDLLPLAVWLLYVGAIAQYLPARTGKRGQRHTPYGEKDRPILVNRKQQADDTATA